MFKFLFLFQFFFYFYFNCPVDLYSHFLHIHTKAHNFKHADPVNVQLEYLNSF